MEPVHWRLGLALSPAQRRVARPAPSQPYTVRHYIPETLQGKGTITMARGSLHFFSLVNSHERPDLHASFWVHLTVS